RDRPGQRRAGGFGTPGTVHCHVGHDGRGSRTDVHLHRCCGGLWAPGWVRRPGAGEPRSDPGTRGVSDRGDHRLLLPLQPDEAGPIRLCDRLQRKRRAAGGYPGAPLPGDGVRRPGCARRLRRNHRHFPCGLRPAELRYRSRTRRHRCCRDRRREPVRRTGPSLRSDHRSISDPADSERVRAAGHQHLRPGRHHRPGRLARGGMGPVPPQEDHRPWSRSAGRGPRQVVPSSMHDKKRENMSTSTMSRKGADADRAIALKELVALVAACGNVSIASGSAASGSAATESSSSGSGGSTLLIAVVPKAIGFDYWTHVKAGAQCAASKLDGVKIDWNGVAAETDITQQVDMLNGYIDQHVDGLVYAATDSKALVSVTQNAQDDEIPVFNIDSGTDPQKVPIFATDNVAGAQQVAKLMNKYLDGQGSVALIEFQPGSMTNDQRKKGFVTGLKKYPNLELAADQADHSDANKALTVTNNILTAHPDLDGIFGSNEPSVIGASQAVKQRGLNGKVTIVGWDAAPDEVKALKSGEIS